MAGLLPFHLDRSIVESLFASVPSRSINHHQMAGFVYATLIIRHANIIIMTTRRFWEWIGLDQKTMGEPSNLTLFFDKPICYMHSTVAWKARDERTCQRNLSVACMRKWWRGGWIVASTTSKLNNGWSKKNQPTPFYVTPRHRTLQKLAKVRPGFAEIWYYLTCFGVEKSTKIKQTNY
jgi:hypothetical protein